MAERKGLREYSKSEMNIIPSKRRVARAPVPGIENLPGELLTPEVLLVVAQIQQARAPAKKAAKAKSPAKSPAKAQTQTKSAKEVRNLMKEFR
jgi:hypothetical protein